MCKDLQKVMKRSIPRRAVAAIRRRGVPERGIDEYRISCLCFDGHFSIKWLMLSFILWRPVIFSVAAGNNSCLAPIGCHFIEV